MNLGGGQPSARKSTFIGGVSLLSLILACDQGPTGPLDGDAGPDTGDADLEIAPPNIPWRDEGSPPIAPPMLTPCPEGWHEVLEEDPEGGPGTVTCDPYGDVEGGGEPELCPDGWTHFVGEAGCTPVGAPCPTGDFPEGLPADAEVLYVLSSASPGGDGTPPSPLTTITDAINVAMPGTVIAIGKGDYDEAVRLRPRVTLWGACAAETRLTASSPGPLAQGVITVPAAGTRVVNLRIGPAGLPGISAFGTGTSVSLDGIIIEGARMFGIDAANGAHVEGRALSITGTGANLAGIGGRGIIAESGSTVDLTRVVVTQSREVAIFVNGGGVTLRLRDAAVHDARRRSSSGSGGRGLNIQGGATAELSRVLLSHNNEVAVYASGTGSMVTLSDVVIRDTRPSRSNGLRGRGLNVQGGATALVSRVVFSQNRATGVFASDLGTSLTLSDIVVRDTQGLESGGTFGRGIGLQDGAAATITRALVVRNHDAGVLARGESTSLTLTDAVIRDTRGQRSDGASGRGLDIQGGPTVEVTRALLSHNRNVGIQVHGEDTSLTASDIVVHDTLGQESDGSTGRGLNVQHGATAHINRAVLSSNRDVGALVLGSATTMRLSNIVVTQTAEQSCAPTTCADEPFGVGLSSGSHATLEANRFEVLDSVLCGVMLTENAQADLSVGVVSGSQVGVCLQVDGYAIPRLTDRVRYVENGINLDATSLPVPAAAAPIDGEM